MSRERTFPCLHKFRIRVRSTRLLQIERLLAVDIDRKDIGDLAMRFDYGFPFVKKCKRRTGIEIHRIGRAKIVHDACKFLERNGRAGGDEREPVPQQHRNAEPSRRAHDVRIVKMFGFRIDVDAPVEHERRTAREYRFVAGPVVFAIAPHAEDRDLVVVRDRKCRTEVSFVNFVALDYDVTDRNVRFLREKNSR